MMRRLFRPNFEFEHQLAAGNSPWQLPKKLAQVNARWAHRVIPLMSPDDYLWLPEIDLLDDESRRRLTSECAQQGVTPLETFDGMQSASAEVELISWGWSQAMTQLATKNGWTFSAPLLETVEWINSRGTSFQFEEKWNIAPAGCRVIHSLTDLKEIVAAQDETANWLVKAEFSMSSRERLMGRGRTLTGNDQNWAEHRLIKGQALYFEPWLDRVAEMSIHFQIDTNRSVKRLGCTHLHTDAHGRYLGNVAVAKNEEAEFIRQWQVSYEQTSAFAEEAASRGYFGPLSIDAMRYRISDGTLLERPLQDINGRFTMGRCELERALSTGELTD
ncbi:hypothetical protein Pan54_45180 [Rubinisphaera italica]|uniref:ATP-grasp domain-containing protein n=1 Tax=Rubinisphaera italica TaxID=2527969 RepID=A0A5C5XLE5_9PLAN|nr:hypothetical protein Pan54_45180 [Rubinisphaera italica]